MEKSNNIKTIEAQLLYDIKEGIYKDENKLPPEAALAEKMGVSRVMIRDALSLLEREGFISRRQGIGTIINKHVISVVTRMDLEVEFLDMIKQAGAEPGIAFVEINTSFCDEKTGLKLGVEKQTPVLIVSKLVTANGKGIIYCKDYISFKIINNYNYVKEDLEKPIFYFLKNFCNKDVYMDLTVVKPIVADKRLADIFKIKEGTPLLNMDEVGYDINGNRILWSEEYYVDDVLEHTILRKKI